MFNGPLFVVGAPRSGTKLLRDLINQHPMVGIPVAETEFLPRLFDIQERFGDLSQRDNFQAFYAWATRFMYFKFIERDVGPPISADTWFERCPSYDVQGVFEALCRHDAGLPTEGPVIWGDKSPNYRNNLPTIRRLWPQARFIHIIRDVRDVAMSAHQAWGKSMVRNAQRWFDEVGACRQWGHSFGDPYMELRYEDLVADTASRMQEISSFLGVDYHPEMCNPGRATENLGDTKGATQVVQGNTAKWKARMDPGLCRRIEAICGPLLAELDYELAHGAQPHQRIGPGRMLGYQLQDGVKLVQLRVEDWGPREALAYTLSAFESTWGS